MISSMSVQRFGRYAQKLCIRVGLPVVAAIIAGGAIVSYVSAAPGDYIWTQSSASTNTNRAWEKVASSADGSKLATVTLGRHVYTSSDGGDSWTEHVIDGPKQWTNVAISDDGSKIALTAWADYMYVSSDGGATWTQQTSPGNKYWLSVAMSPDGSKLVAAAGLGQSIYTSTDGGASWVERVVAGSHNWRAVTISSDGVKMAATDSGGHVWTSNDAGNTWQQQTGSEVRNWEAIAASSDGTKLIASALNGQVYASDDSGVSWSTYTTFGASSSYRAVAMSDNGEVRMVAGPCGQMHKSVDAGGTWMSANAASGQCWSGVALSSDGLKVIASAKWNRVYTSPDGGVTWRQEEILGEGSWQTVALSADGSTIVAGGLSDSIYTSHDGGQSWQKRPGSGAREWRSVAVSADGTRIIATSQNSSIMLSYDGGETWTERTLPDAPWLASVAMSSDGSTLLVGANDGGIYRSTDSGNTWSRMTSLNSSGGWFGVDMSADGMTMVAADSFGADYAKGAAYISKDGGESWDPIASIGDHYWHDWLYGGVSVSADGTTIMVVDSYGADWNGGSVYISRDGGAGWTTVSSLGNQPWSATAITGDGSVMVVAACNRVAYLSVDYGQTWAEQSSMGSQCWTSAGATLSGDKLGLASGDSRLYFADKEGPATTSIDLLTLNPSNQQADNKVITSASLSVRSDTCYTLDQQSIETRGAAGVIPPADDIEIIGGVSFGISCTVPGGSSDVTLALGGSYQDVSMLRAYKMIGGALQDITASVSFTNEVLDGAERTVMRYSLTDGGPFDADGEVNGVIKDPIYIGAPRQIEPEAPSSAIDELAETGMSQMQYAGIVGAAILIGVIGVGAARRASINRVTR